MEVPEYVTDGKKIDSYLFGLLINEWLRKIQLYKHGHSSQRFGKQQI
jgi:hypothetical protein